MREKQTERATALDVEKKSCSRMQISTSKHEKSACRHKGQVHAGSLAYVLFSSRSTEHLNMKRLQVNSIRRRCTTKHAQSHSTEVLTHADANAKTGQAIAALKALPLRKPTKVPAAHAPIIFCSRKPSIRRLIKRNSIARACDHLLFMRKASVAIFETEQGPATCALTFCRNNPLLVQAYLYSLSQQVS